jgi:hypothetical protein
VSIYCPNNKFSNQVIDQTIRYICDEINHHLDNPVTPVQELFAVIGNIVRLDTDGAQGELSNRIVITLVNIEEEKALKNEPHYIKANQTAQRVRPPVFLNLYLLFTCTHSDYGTALAMLSRLIGFFQVQNAFNAGTANVAFPSGLERITLDLHSLTTEQLNHLWGILGSKHLPSALYKLRLTPVQESTPAPVEVVETVQVGTKIKLN